MLVALWGEEDSMKGEFIPFVVTLAAALVMVAPVAGPRRPGRPWRSRDRRRWSPRHRSS
jgi:hypothetical protein